jgi:ribosomal protein S18 acetylase RimI-like enzyme
MNTDYTYSFLTPEQVNEDVVQHINQLLEQLSFRKNRLTQIDLIFALQDNMKILIAQQGTLIVGMGIICRVPRLSHKECEIHDIVIDSNHRRKGIARKILSQLITEGQNYYGAKYINLTSRPDRKEANELYKNYGFVLQETNYYRMTFE